MTYLIILFLFSLGASVIGWKYFIYFFSLGYGLAISVLALVCGILFRTALSPVTVIACCLLLVFGLRLSGYLLLREKRSSNYRKILFDPAIKQQKPLGVMFTVWFFCALLYVGQISPLAFRLANIADGTAAADGPAWAALVLMAAGIALETFADLQKSAAKKTRPGRFVDTGLYRLVRCPNYLGEVVLWTGTLLLCFGAGSNWWQWAIALAGYLGIVYVMFSGARRLELRQDKMYGSDPEYLAYIAKTPILLPFIPLYSVKKYKWLVA